MNWPKKNLYKKGLSCKHCGKQITDRNQTGSCAHCRMTIDQRGAGNHMYGKIYTKEEFDGYIALSIGDDGYCHPVVNDATFRTKIGTVKIPLPLPENFVYHYEEDWTEKEGTVSDFLYDLEFCSQYTSIAWFKDGKLVEARRYDWPAFLKDSSD